MQCLNPNIQINVNCCKVETSWTVFQLQAIIWLCCYCMLLIYLQKKTATDTKIMVNLGAGHDNISGSQQLEVVVFLLLSPSGGNCRSIGSKRKRSIKFLHWCCCSKEEHSDNDKKQRYWTSYGNRNCWFFTLMEFALSLCIFCLRLWIFYLNT